MKKIIVLLIFICLGGGLFAQMGIDLGLGFEYGTARVIDDGTTVRKLTEPGAVITFRFVPNTVGFFGRLGLLFPSKVTEGGVTLTYSKYDYILFVNSGLGASFKVPINDRFVFFVDAGMSINDLFYGSSFKDTIDASWKIKIENLGTTYSGGHIFKNVDMKEKYNDWAFGLLGNVAMRFRFTSNLSLELGLAASFDFVRYRSYRFVADFTNATMDNTGTHPTTADLQGSFPADKINGTELHLESNGKFSIFKQFTFIPSLSILYSF